MCEGDLSMAWTIGKRDPRQHHRREPHPHPALQHPSQPQQITANGSFPGVRRIALPVHGAGNEHVRDRAADAHRG